MSFLVEVAIEIDVSPELGFDVLADHPSWKNWMPRGFMPTSPANGPHKLGNKLAVKIAGLPGSSTLAITAFDRPKKLAWCGGVRGVVHADHQFIFESNGKGGTKVTSHETWSGVLASLLKFAVSPQAIKLGGEQLQALAQECKARVDRSAP